VDQQRPTAARNRSYLRRGPTGRRLGPGGQRSRRATALIVLAVVLPQLVLAGVLAVRLGYVPGPGTATAANAQAKDRAEALRVGDCVRAKKGEPGAYVEVACSDGRPAGTVVGLVDGPPTATEGCAEETDFFALQRVQVVCLRRVSGPHPGDPGQGGGVYRPGDCVAAGADSGVNEVPCAASTVSETVTARVDAVRRCTAPAVRFATLDTGSRRILCLGDGPGIAGPGECMGDPRRPPVTFDAISCADPAARAKVLARAATPAACRALPAQTHYVRDPSGLPATRMVCVQALPVGSTHQPPA
jgi:hypothetical protein